MAGVEDETVVPDMEDIQGDVWSVAELNEAIQDVVQAANDAFPTYVVGEVADVSTYSYGTFFELRDVEADAVISCLVWASRRASFEYDIEEGTAAIVRAQVDFYAERGNMQLLVANYWPVGESDRAQALAELRASLEEEGLLEEDRKQTLPGYASCIGLVTSRSGSAIEDFTTAVNDRSPRVEIRLCAATVQGDGAVPALVGAVRRLERDPYVEVIVVTRGGGSDTDLWCFNEEPVVRAIADCATPVVVAVGHEDDETLAEAVADRRAMTPTDAASATTRDVSEVRRELCHLETRVDSAYTGLVVETMDDYERRVEAGYVAVKQAVAAQVATLQRAADLERRVSTAYRTLVAETLASLDRVIDDAVRSIEHAAETDAVTARAARGRVGDLEARIDRAYHANVDRKLDVLERRVEDAYRDVETDAKVRAGTTEARRLRIVVAVLLVLLVVGSVAVALLLL